jgi:hypothetical protein
MILRKRVIPAIFMLAVSLSTAAAHADTFLYTFTGVNSAPVGGDGLSVGFQYLSPAGPVTTLTELLVSDVISCTNCASGFPVVEFNPNSAGLVSVGVVDVNLIQNLFYFPLGAFSTPGTYNAISLNAGTLIVQDLSVTPPTVTPEPGTFVLMLSGIGCALARGGRKRRSNN